MLAPRSYTREDVVELQCHGSEVCLRRVLRACLEAGASLAEPGLPLIYLKIIIVMHIHYQIISTNCKIWVCFFVTPE